MSDETRWDAIRRQLGEGNWAFPVGRVHDLLDELEAEAKSLRDDAALGKLVRRMPELNDPRGHFSSSLVCYWPMSTWWSVHYRGHYAGNSDSPEAALREALGEERDDKPE